MSIKLYPVLSFAGTKLKEIKVEQLPDHNEDISIRGNELAVAGLNTKTLLLFKIIY